MTTAPWIDPIATLEIERIIKQSDRRPFYVFEWGSGGSTLWLADLECIVVSVEHDNEWFEKVEREIERRLHINAALRFVPFGADYPGQIKKEGRLFDLILIDGRRRVECFKNAMPCLAQGGCIILHDSERERYAECREIAGYQGLVIREIREARNTLFCQMPN